MPPSPPIDLINWSLGLETSSNSSSIFNKIFHGVVLMMALAPFNKFSDIPLNENMEESNFSPFEYVLTLVTGFSQSDAVT